MQVKLKQKLYAIGKYECYEVSHLHWRGEIILTVQPEATCGPKADSDKATRSQA